MPDTSRLSLPFLSAAQGQKHVTHNEALAVLDRLVLLAVEARALAAPPANPAEGSRYLVAAAASGAWAGHAGEIAVLEDGIWQFHVPRPGWLAYVVAEDLFVVRTAAGWRAFVVGDPLPQLGINATADTTNRLAVAAAATLLGHAGAGHQLKINKRTPTDTATVLFQTGYSGRAEIGTAGTDRFGVKVSPDGAAWLTVAEVDPGTGFIGLRKANPEVDVDIAGNVARVAGPSFACVAVKATGTGGHEYRVAATDNGNGLGGGKLVIFDQTVGAIRLVIDGQAVAFGLPARLPSLTVSTLPSAATSGAGAVVFVSDERGGPVLAYSDGSVWRRTTDRAVAA